MSPKNPSDASTEVPLCVDLDGTFIRSDLLIEGVLRLLRHRPLDAWRIPFWLSRGKAHLKAKLARAVDPPVTAPPVNKEIESWLYEEKAKGGTILLVTASHEEALGPVRNLFPFDEIITSDDHTNLKGERKAQLLVERFGEKGFDYAGDSSSDTVIWDRARKAIPVFHRNVDSQKRRRPTTWIVLSAPTRLHGLTG